MQISHTSARLKIKQQFGLLIENSFLLGILFLHLETCESHTSDEGQREDSIAGLVQVGHLESVPQVPGLKKFECLIGNLKILDVKMLTNDR